MQVTRQSILKLRALCRDYGTGFTMPRTFLSTNRMHKGKPNASAESDSSPSDFAEEDEEDYLQWHDLRDVLSCLRPHTRVHALEDLSEALEVSRAKAEACTADLDSFVSSEDSEELLNFRAEDMEACKAVRRCVELLPNLRKVTHQVEATPSEKEDSVDSESDEADYTAIDQKLQIPSVEHSSLHKLCNVLRADILSAAKAIDEGEQELQVRQLALGYVDGTVKPTQVDSGLLHRGISLAKEMRAKVHEEQRAEVLREFKLRKEALDMPTEADVEKMEQECAQRKADTEFLARRVECSKDDGTRKRTKGADDCPVDFTVAEAPALIEMLLHEIAEAEESIRERQEAVIASEVMLANAEGTVTRLEEANVLLLTQIGKEAPAILAQAVEEFLDHGVDTPVHDLEEDSDGEEEIQLRDERLHVPDEDDDPAELPVVQRFQELADRLKAPTSLGCVEDAEAELPTFEAPSVQRAIRMRDRNSEMAEKVKELQAVLERASLRQESPLKPVCLQMRQELLALRQRWWSNRQDGTVRRAAVGQGYIFSETTAEQPVVPSHATLFERLTESMNLT